MLNVKLNNDLGEYNESVNVIVHWCYFIDEIKTFILYEEFPLKYKFNLYNEIKIIFEKYEKLTNPIYEKKMPPKMKFINANELKKEFKFMFNDRTMNDPIDIIFIIVNSFHDYAINSDSFAEVNETKCDINKCMAHKLFHVNLVEQCECMSCGYSSDLFTYSYHAFFYQIQCKQIINFIHNNKTEINFEEINAKLVLIIKEMNEINYINYKFNCCNNKKLKVNQILLSSSKYFSFLLFNDISIIEIKLQDICKLLFMIPISYSNDTLFEIYDANEVKTYRLYSIIFKKGKDHYTIMIYDKNRHIYIHYDDMNNCTFDSYRNVVQFAIKNQLCPLCITYIQSQNEDKEKEILSNKDYEMYLEYSIKIDKEIITQYQNENNTIKQLRPNNNELKQISHNEMIKLIELFKDNINKRKESGDYDFEDKEKLLSKLIHRTNSKENNDNKSNKTSFHNDKWECENCKHYNDNTIYQCVQCSNFNYEIYKQIMLSNTNRTLSHNTQINIDEYYNRILHKNKSNTFKCWQCGHLNPYYKLKCSYCHFDISYPIPIITKPKYEIIKEPKILYKEITKYQSRKEEIKYEKSSLKWECSYCKNENMNINYCKKCYKNNNL